MNSICKRSVFAVVLGALLALSGALAPKPASAQFAVACVNCSSWVTQLLEYARQIAAYATQLEQYSRQIAQYQLQIQQYQNMVRNSQSLTESFFDNALRTVRDTRSLLRQAQGVTYASNQLHDLFNREFPDAVSVFANLRNSPPQTTWDAFYKNVDKSWKTMTVVESTLMAARRQADEMEYEQEAMDRIGNQLMGADGHMDVMQSMGQLTQHSAQQMIKLRQLSMMQVNLAARAAADQQSKDNAAHAALQEFLFQPPTPATSQVHGSNRYPRGPSGTR